LSLGFDSEAAFCRAAAGAAVSWRGAGIPRLVAGLAGELGVGKTTFVRALLSGLGHAGRVPSPTYTLLEHYEIGGLTVVHLDLYRLAEPREIEFLGLRDWLALPEVWLLAEWPARGGAFADALDLELGIGADADERRSISPRALTEVGRKALDAWLGTDFKYSL